MKKVFILVAAIFFVSSMAYADFTPISGTLQVYGMIEEGGVFFDVNQTSSARINLISDTEVQPTGLGVEIGNWIFQSVRPESSVPYRVTYEYEPMYYYYYDGTTGTDYYIAYEILEKNTEAGTSAIRESGSEFAWTAPAASSSVTRVIAVRLTTAGRTVAIDAPSSEDYSSTITITLVSP